MKFLWKKNKKFSTSWFFMFTFACKSERYNALKNKRKQ